MATKNEVAKQQDATLIEYEAGGEKVKLSFSMIKNYLVSGGGNITDQEAMMFLSLCRYQHLNPFIREAYIIKFGNTSPATIVTGKDVFTKRADKNPNYEGKQAGVIVLTKDGQIIEREGSFVLKTEELVGGWAKIFIKGHREPEYSSVSFDEYVGKKKDGEINSQWKTKPATMIRKVAVVQALREAFPDDFQGLYAQEEFGNISDVKLDTAEVVQNEIEENSNKEEFEIIDEPEVVEQTEKKEPEVPDFMKQE